jgi:LemA protein
VGRGVVVAILAGLVVLALLVGLALVYNRLVRDRNRVRHTWADIDALLVRRAAAIPRLAGIVDAAFDHERETLEEVAQARAAVESAGGGPTVEHGLAERRLGVAGQRLVAVAEAYPELQAQAAAADLIAALKDVEGDLARARMVYNRTVQTYEDRRRALPGALVAGPLGFRHEPYWQPSEPIVG